MMICATCGHQATYIAPTWDAEGKIATKDDYYVTAWYCDDHGPLPYLKMPPAKLVENDSTLLALFHNIE